MNADSEPSFSYDEVPYTSHPYPKSHPRHMAAIGVLFGMSPPDVNRCRVLEIGCASGGNLIPMAVQFPDTEFVGLDASRRQIDEGRSAVDSLSLQNIRLLHQDILDFPADSDPFDYVICHGVYSWVPAAVQEKILSICRDHLSANGIAYISYNTYPGWYLRRGVREMMSYHAAGFDETQAKIDQSRALLGFLSGAVAQDQGAYAQLLHDELGVLQTSEDSYLFHEHLEDVNEPLFFHEFNSRAEAMKLRFLGEAFFAGMISHGFDTETQETLAKIAPDIVQMEQYLDFLRNRKFRQTMLCHGNVELSRAIDPERVRSLAVGSSLAPQVNQDESEPGYVFEHPSGQRVTVTSEVQRVGLERLAESWPREWVLEELAAEVIRQLATDEVSQDECVRELGETLLECYSSGLVDFFSTRVVMASKSDTPRASEFARLQATRGERATNLRHETVHLEKLDCDILQRLDGKTTVESIATELLDAFEPVGEGDETPEKPSREEFGKAVDYSVGRLARTGLLQE